MIFFSDDDRKLFKRRTIMPNLILESIITCPKCSFAKKETMPTDSCRFFL